jgi:hypothetical protein
LKTLCFQGFLLFNTGTLLWLSQKAERRWRYKVSFL